MTGPTSAVAPTSDRTRLSDRAATVTGLVSAVIPTFNRAELLGRAVASALTQDYPLKEIIVVDDGSEDGTAALLRPLAERGAIIHLHQENRGVSAARNLGIKKSRGEFIAFLDSDDEWLPRKLSAQVAFLRANPELDFVQTQERWMRGGRRVNPGRKHLKKGGDIFFESLALCLISPSATMLRRSLLDEVGLFDEDLLAAEDYDLWLRILRDRPAGLIDEEHLIRHGGRDDQLSARHSLDKYRVLALEKLLRSGLPADRAAAAETELERRRRIYEDGVKKRGGGHI